MDTVGRLDVGQRYRDETQTVWSEVRDETDSVVRGIETKHRQCGLHRNFNHKNDLVIVRHIQRHYSVFVTKDNKNNKIFNDPFRSSKNNEKIIVVIVKQN